VAISVITTVSVPKRRLLLRRNPKRVEVLYKRDERRTQTYFSYQILIKLTFFLVMRTRSGKSNRYLTNFPRQDILLIHSQKKAADKAAAEGGGGK
jgi:hypothetical protein